MIFRRKKGSKYLSKKVKHDGITFDSKKEGERYLELKKMQESGEIGDIIVHRLYELAPKTITENGEKLRAIKYEADFVYENKKDGKIYIEDVKSDFTRKLATYRLKRNLLLRMINSNTVFVELN